MNNEPYIAKLSRLEKVLWTRRDARRHTTPVRDKPFQSTDLIFWGNQGRRNRGGGVGGKKNVHHPKSALLK